MNPRRLLATAAAVSVLSAFGPHSFGVWAQDNLTMAVCRPGWEWNRNSLGQDACTIASVLDAACRVITTYTIPPINSSQNYAPPDRDHGDDLKCQCDTVAYSLYMECTMCQGGIIYPWPRWDAQCDTVYVSQYAHDVPQGTAIPRWAFINVTSLPSQVFSESLAISIGRDPEEPPKQVSTLSRTESSTLSSTKTRTPSGGTPSPTHTSGGSGGKSNTGAIVGGVVGSVVPLSILAVLVFFYVRRQKRGGGNQPAPRPHSRVSEYSGQPGSPTLSSTGIFPPYNPFRPEDPATYPAQMSDGQGSLSGMNPLSHPRRGQYRGAAEV